MSDSSPSSSSSSNLNSNSELKLETSQGKVSNNNVLNYDFSQDGNYHHNQDLELIMNELLKDRTDINELRNDLTPLMIAVDFNNESLVEELLARGADPNIVGKSTALMMAIEIGNLYIISLLIHAKANPNLGSGKEGYKPLSLAIMKKIYPLSIY